jgi:hypothetical protein
VISRSWRAACLTVVVGVWRSIVVVVVCLPVVVVCRCVVVELSSSSFADASSAA